MERDLLNGRDVHIIGGLQTANRSKVVYSLSSLRFVIKKVTLITFGRYNLIKKKGEEMRRYYFMDVRFFRFCCVNGHMS